LDPTTQYARDVIDGRVVAGRLVRLACERHLRDLDTGAARGLRFDPAEAQAAFDFWRLCPHLKGKRWAGETIDLESWERFIVGSVYGWKRTDGRRRFRVAWVEVARKNGKTTLIYPAGLYGLVCDGEPGAEVYSVATKRDQARISFNLARAAVGKVPDLAEVVTRYRLEMQADDGLSKFEPLSADADTLDGLSPSTVLADEIHKWRGRDLWDVIETGMGARSQPLLWATTTAGDEGEEAVYGQEHNYSVQVLEGTVEDDSRFAYVATLDAGDEWTDPAVWVKANPNLGVSVQADEIAGQVAKAKASPAAANAVKRLRLNVRTQDADCWIPLQLWDAARSDRLTREAMKGFPCYSALDLASTTDFAALAHCFPVTEDFEPAPDPTAPALYAFSWRCWIPALGRSHREQKLREIVRPWADAGWVIQTEGDAIDHGAIESAVVEDSRHFDLRGLAYDPFNAAQLATRLQAGGLDVVKFPQSMGAFAGPTQRFEELLLNGFLRHDGNPAARWMGNNVVLVANAAGHRMPGRKKSRQKIDMIVAAVMALGRAMAETGGGPSFYETNGIEAV
jgi:phage terminase large subunit-like protein